MMKKVIIAVTFAVTAVTSLTALSGCAENIQSTGNKIVSNAKDYAKSELGVDSDISSIGQIGDKAVSYLEGELGLNNSDNKAIEGKWKSEDTENDWVWTFDGENQCKLTSQKTGFFGAGLYSVNESESSVEILLNVWGDETRTFRYKLRKTLSDEYLELIGDADSYNLKKQN